MNITFLIIISLIGLICVGILIFATLDSNGKKYKTYEVFIHDQYYDHMTDNDDLEDRSTIVRVIYNERGEILEIDFADCTSDLCNNESPISIISHFYKTCKINPNGGLSEYKKYTIYK